MTQIFSNVFGTLGVATSGMGVYKTWLNAVADNVANMNNVSRTSDPAFRERFVTVEPSGRPDEPGRRRQGDRRRVRRSRTAW